jgi:2-keto-4-pentenoate hydratase/2-oxohepta-3-ene-1,7-dioic acid hydratase in catechol pathway
MRIRTIHTDQGLAPAIALADGRSMLLDELTGPGVDLQQILDEGRLDDIADAVGRGVRTGAIVDDAVVAAPYLHPRKIFGIGLNYGAHASDLGEAEVRSSPASFIKGDHTIIGPGADIVFPPHLGRVTAEAELGLVIGRECFEVSEDDALSYVAGVVAVLDQTAEEVLLENPRYLTRVKNYPTFFSFGPDIITLDEVLAATGTLDQLSVSTISNGRVHRQDLVSGMTFSPAELLSFHSHVMPFYPGDILSTGTPGAVALTPGDEVSCVLGDGLSTLTNTVGTWRPRA